MNAHSSASLHELQSTWELARAARNVIATVDDDKNAALGDLEGRLEQLMFAAPAHTVVDVSVKLWLIQEAFDAQWSRADIAMLLSQVDAACRHLAWGRRHTVAEAVQ